ncbi:hypothetical protein TNIN_237491 [Trichonephila inaurata madagascariensis]|uniref:Uncharacterized protein n=1 Tax=Trichonephila inaurata madagascariensis TaxID=2747483 RepID=A0A8X6YM23_9ARAC|nr:hypothetical protein TNIN_237491 [Trichonephila inaurata madagascariensis]
MADFHEYRVAVKVFFSGTETFEMSKSAHKNNGMGKPQVFERFNRSKNSAMSNDDKTHSSRSPTSLTHENVEKIHEIIK